MGRLDLLRLRAGRRGEDSMRGRLQRCLLVGFKVQEVNDSVEELTKLNALRVFHM